MNKSIFRERESEAFILGNGREREFPLTPGCAFGNALQDAGFIEHMMKKHKNRGVNCPEFGQQSATKPQLQFFSDDNGMACLIQSFDQS